MVSSLKPSSSELSHQVHFVSESTILVDIESLNLKDDTDTLLAQFHKALAQLQGASTKDDGSQSDSVRDRTHNSFVGFITFGSHFIVSLPKVFGPKELPEEKRRRLAKLVYKVFNRYRRRKPEKTAIKVYNNSRNQYNRPGSQSDRKASQIHTAHTLIEDFQHNGLWKPHRQVHKKDGNGAISWHRTIGGTLPIQSRSGVFYPEPIHNHSILHHNHRLRQLHNWVLYQAYQHYGWLVTQTEKNPLDWVQKPGTTSELLQIATTQLRQSYSDRDLRLWGALVAYLKVEPKGESPSSLKFLGTFSFHVIFEEMCRWVFEMQDTSIVDSNDERWSNLKATIQWEQTSDSTQKKWNNQGNILDILLPLEVDPKDEKAIIKPKTGSDVLVLDAKYYDMETLFKEGKGKGSLKRAPSLTDVRKQYVYGQFVRQSQGVEATRNALCFPVVPQGEEPIRVIGHVKFDLDKKSVDTAYEKPICLFGLSLEWLMKHYILSARKEEELQKKLWVLWDKSKDTEIKVQKEYRGPYKLI
jgi:hypothetical protein